MAQFCTGRGCFISEQTGCLKYMSPESVKGKYTVKSDIWSLGILMFFLLYGFDPFGAKTSKRTCDKILKGFKKVRRMYFTKRSPGTPEARDLIEKLLNSDPAQRLTITEVLKHKWLAEDFDASDAPKLDGILENLKKNTTKAKLMGDVLGVMTKCQLSKEQIAELKEKFEAADSNGDGALTVEELRDSLQNTHLFPEDELAGIIEMVNVSTGGKISYDELLKSAVQKKLAADETRVYEAFQKFDKDGDGKISVQEMVEVLGKSETEVKALMSEIDKDNDGEIEYSEFMAMWAKESGGYLWDDNIEEIKRDKERTKQEVSHRRASIVSSMPIPSTTSVTSTETAQETKEEGSAPEEKKAPAPSLPSAEELLANLQSQPTAQDDGDAGGWAAIALDEDDDEDEPEA